MRAENSLLKLDRRANFFARHGSQVENLEKSRQLVFLAPDQLLHPQPGTEYIVRLGKIRVSQFLEDGREMTRAVLQAGATLAIVESGPQDDLFGGNPAADLYSLPDMVLMALGEAELWSLPAGSLSTNT